MKKLSIGLRLMLLYLAVFLIAEAILGAGLWIVIRQNLFAIADTALDGQAADLQRFLEAGNEASAAQLPADLGEHYKIERSRDYLQISDAAGNLIYRSRFFREHPLPPLSFDDLDRPIYENRKLGEERFRFLNKQLDVNGRTYILRIAHPMHEESATLNAIQGDVLWFAPLLLLLASAAGYWLSRRTLPNPQDKPA